MLLIWKQKGILENLIGIHMAREIDELLKEIKEYRNDMVARNYPHQRISDIITKYESKDFLEEAEKEKKELNESYQESVRQAKERKE
jgi:dissimilatory sulfite reductase (desulfoviridin) alpha/beta subunit